MSRPSRPPLPSTDECGRCGKCESCLTEKLERASAANTATSAEVAGILARKGMVSRRVKDVHDEARRTGKVRVPGMTGEHQVAFRKQG